MLHTPSTCRQKRHTITRMQMCCCRVMIGWFKKRRIKPRRKRSSTRRRARSATSDTHTYLNVARMEPLSKSKTIGGSSGCSSCLRVACAQICLEQMHGRERRSQNSKSQSFDFDPSLLAVQNGDAHTRDMALIPEE